MRTLTFVVNGETVLVRCAVDAPLVVPMCRALRLTRNLGRPFEDWDVRHANGMRVDESEPAPLDESLFFVSLQVGCGGRSTLRVALFEVRG